jgi:hypothetical protein
VPSFAKNTKATVIPVLRYRSLSILVSSNDYLMVNGTAVFIAGQIFTYWTFGRGGEEFLAAYRCLITGSICGTVAHMSCGQIAD